MTILPYLLELRPALTGRRLFRLYYAEPKGVEGALLPLALSTKKASSETVEQNASIDDAKMRSRRWTFERAIGATGNG